MRAALLALAVSGVATGAAAQGAPEPTPDEHPATKWELGAGAVLAEPVGDFARYVGTGTGFRFFGILDPGPPGGFALRLDGTLISYGKISETYDLAFGGTDETVDVTTANTIASFAIGPHVVIGQGPIRPYFGASIGSAQFATTTSAWAGGRPIPIASTTEMERHTLSMVAGGGVRLRLRERTRPISLELDGRYLRHGRTEYLPEGGVRGLPDGSVALDPVTSNANLWTVHLALAIGLR